MWEMFFAGWLNTAKHQLKPDVSPWKKAEHQLKKQRVKILISRSLFLSLCEKIMELYG